MMIVSSQCPSNVARVSFTSLIFPLTALVNSPPPKNGYAMKESIF